jgi:hypothetical protein
VPAQIIYNFHFPHPQYTLAPNHPPRRLQLTRPHRDAPHHGFPCGKRRQRLEWPHRAFPDQRRARTVGRSAATQPIGCHSKWGRIEGIQESGGSGRRGRTEGFQASGGGVRRGHSSTTQKRDARGQFKCTTPPNSSSSGTVGGTPTLCPLVRTTPPPPRRRLTARIAKSIHPVRLSRP